nr:hypothetical protein [uncultured Acetatifactor sp.]
MKADLERAMSVPKPEGAEIIHLPYETAKNRHLLQSMTVTYRLSRSFTLRVTVKQQNPPS